MGSEFKKQIFLYWHSGLTNAPELVLICVESWRRQNPGWKVIVLNDETVPQFVDMEDVRLANPHITIQAYSDALRWRLLRKHGGVWADATLYCNRSLDSWRPWDHAPKGFFAFRTPEVHLYHSWFLVGHPDNPVVQGMNRELDRFLLLYGGFRHYMDL